MSLTVPGTSQEQDLVAAFLMDKQKQIKGKRSPELLMFSSNARTCTLDRAGFFSLVAV